MSSESRPVKPAGSVAPRSRSHSANAAKPRQASRTARYKPGDAKYSEIISKAKKIITTSGYDSMTVSSIATETGMTRSLFYHYFKSKEEVADAVLDEIVNEYLSKLEQWNTSRVLGNVDKALEDITQILYRTVHESTLFKQQLLQGGNAALYVRFMDKAADRIAAYISDTTVKDFAKRHKLEIKNVHETFYMMIVGLIAYVRSHPLVDLDVIKQVAAQTLHIEKFWRSPMTKTSKKN